jgi:excinuclease ABC subunit A
MVLAPLAVSEPVEDQSSSPSPSSSSVSLLRRVESVRTVLLKSGFTRVLAGGKEIRLDEEGNGPVRRILAELKSAPPAGRADLFLVVDRAVVAESVQSRMAGSLEQAFERGAGTAAVLREGRDIELHTRWPSCPAGHTALKSDLAPSMFSFSSHQGACRRCRGLGIENRIDVNLLFRNPASPVLAAMDRAVASFLQAWRPSVLALLKGLCSYLGIPRDMPWKDLGKEDSDAILHGLGDRKVPLQIEGGLKMEASWAGLLPQIESWLDDLGWGRLPGLEGLYKPQICGSCGGGRLQPESMAVRVGGLNIQEISALTVRAARDFLKRLELGARETAIAEQVVVEMENRLGFLEEVGLHYLTLDRTANTLSGGEAQRIRLASQLGNRLAGVLYVLDEPTVGLHQRDTQRLISSLRELRGHGNTILMIEHDRETMLQADWIIDMGPGAGAQGGRVVAMGTPAEVAACPESLTGRHLQAPHSGKVRARRRIPGRDRIVLEGVKHHNLRDIRVEFPLGLFTVVTGVSGSGKSTLVLDVLAEAAAASVSGKPPPAGRSSAVHGLEKIRRVVVVDQKPIGRTPRSTPATYTGLWDLARDLYAMLPSSKVKGYGASRFSFNTGEGRCLACDGQGARQIEMHFLPDVWVPCEVCGGRRFDGETLGVHFKGKSVGDVLEMEVGQALDFFQDQPRMRRVLETLQAVGLGYLKLGQSSDTLSGGEAQRVKIAAELITRQAGGTLYVLDEPTTGLHFEDVRRLLDVLDALVEGGNTLVVIEHHLDVICAADWVIDLGPEAAEEGGLVVAAGPPEEVARSPDSATGRYLKAYLSAGCRASRGAVG